MKKILMLIVIAFIASCCGSEKDIKNDNRFYTNLDLRIVLINSESSLSNDKFHHPQLCNTILFETLVEPKLYWEYSTCKRSPDKIKIDTQWLYNHRTGDIVHFDYLRKDNFFTIREDRRP